MTVAPVPSTDVATSRSGGAPRGATAGLLGAVLAGASVLLLNVGALVSVTTGAGTLNVPGAYLPVALLLVHVLVALGLRTQVPRGVGLALGVVVVLVGALTPALLVSVEGAAALVVYAGFALGTAGGLVVGATWAAGRVDVAGMGDVLLALLAVITTTALLGSVDASPLSAAFHALAHTSWGGSNLVAGVLVVVAWLLVARARETAGAWWLWGAAAVAMLGAATTVSRGAALAGAVSLVVACWTLPTSRVWRTRMRRGSLLVALLGAFAFGLLSAARGSSAQAAVNVTARFDLWEMGWGSFTGSPVLGTGWLGLRDLAGDALANQSFAHNVVFSFLQIGGLGGVLFLVVLVVGAIRGVARRPAFAPAIVAALVASMTDPFFENFVASFVAWGAIAAANALPAERRASRAAAGVLG